MADYDVLDMAVMLRDAQRSLRKLFPDYEAKAEPCRRLLRRMMADIPTDKVLVALTHALQAVVDANGGSQVSIAVKNDTLLGIDSLDNFCLFHTLFSFN